MTALGAFLLGALVGRIVLRAISSLLDTPTLNRANYRGHQLHTSAGIAVIVAAIAGAAVAAVASTIRPQLALLHIGVVGGGGSHERDGLTVYAVLWCVLGFGLLGVLDDLLATADDRGFAGHLRALCRGRLSTGALKLIGGAAVALTLGSELDGGRVHQRLLVVVLDAAVIALSANTANLFDRAPGRTLKVTGLAYGVLAVVAIKGGSSGDLGAVGFVVGAGAALLRADLDERIMLGDAGANPLGAVLGVGACLTVGVSARIAVLAVLVALNAVSEVLSFSRIIDRVAVLRWADRLGARPERRAFMIQQ